MVFGWGKKKEVKVEEVAPSKKEITLSEVPRIIDELTELRTKQITSEVKVLRDKTNPKIKELADIAKKLEKDDLKADDIENIQ